MKKLSCLLFSSKVLLLTTMVNNCFAAGFDCTQAGTEVEKIICSNQELSKLDEQLAKLYKSAIQSENPDAVKKQQQDWLRQIRNPCREQACLLKAYQQRIAELSALGETGWKLFSDSKLGIEFSYPAQRKISEYCHESKNCIALVEPSMPVNTDYLIAFEVFDGDLNQVAIEKAVFEKTGQGWIAKGRTGEHPVQLLTGEGWQGIKAVVDCGITDENGFHAAAGECLWAVLSNGKRSVVIDSEGVAGNDELSVRSIQSLRFVR